MAINIPATGDSYTVKKYAIASQLLVESISETFFADKSMIADDDSNVIRLVNNLSKGKGDTLNYQLRLQLTGAGATEGQALVGNEESLQYLNDSITINSLRHAVRVPGDTHIGKQRTEFDQYEDARPALKDWFAVRIDTWAANQLAAYTPQTDSKYTGLNSVTSIDTNHVVRPSTITADESLTSSHPFTLDLIDKALNKARLLTNNPLRPIKIGGKDYYVTFIHPNQEYNMVTSTTTGGWLDIHKAILQGGALADSGLLNGALGVYKNVIIHSWSRVPQGVNSSTSTTAITTVRRAIFCGAGALTMALGNATPSLGEDGLPIRFAEDGFDYGDEDGVAATLVGGLKAATFSIGGTSTSFGRIVIPTYAVAP